MNPNTQTWEKSNNISIGAQLLCTSNQSEGTTYNHHIPHTAVQKIFVYFQNCLCALMGKIVEMQQVHRVKLSKSRTLGCIPVHPGRRCTAPDKP